ncbi:Alpha-tubulin N-acetyltransferase 1 [Sarcoptes scabiei]|uniref:Alpha-tubulin N-acetyltransferase 1 n=1 Tax=Sarcoptes scabiei TaxID=52283 RepID=A0A834V883_SARSC|nr:Alpha-tubulin N-acetyltransferase 1 [Sarcoptes scabiei]
MFRGDDNSVKECNIITDIAVISADRNLVIKPIFNLSYSDRSDDFIENENARCDKLIKHLTREILTQIIDKLGYESSAAQQLQIPITSSNKFLSDSNDDLMLILFRISKHSFKEMGFIRFGRRDLYFDDGNSLRNLLQCPCILDFYIRFKRKGFGKILFDLTLKHLSIDGPQSLAYDRPSFSLLSFLRKYFNLDQPLWQHNHFVIFSQIFDLFET